MAEFLGKSQVQVGNALEHRVKNLGEDLASLMGAVGKGVEVYNKAGETAAKLEVSEDARIYQEQVNTLTSSLTYANDDPEVYSAVNARIDELTNEFLAKSEKFYGQKIAYDTYRNYAVDVASNTKMQFEPMFNKGFLSASIKQSDRGISDKANAAGLAPSSELLSLAKTQGQLYGQDIFHSESLVANPHLDAMDGKLKSTSASEIAEQILTNRKFDPAKAADFLNRMTGSLVKYNVDDKGGISLTSDITSQRIREQYLDRFRTLQSTFSRKDNVENVDLKVLKTSTAPIPTTLGTYEDNLQNLTALAEHIAIYENSAGKQIQSIADSQAYATEKITALNFEAKNTALYAALTAGKNLNEVTYQGYEAYNNNNESVEVIKSATPSPISETDRNSFVSAYVSNLESKFGSLEYVEPSIFKSVIKTDKGAFNTFVGALKNAANGIGSIPDIQTARNLQKNLEMFASDTSSPLSPIEKDIFSDIAGVIKIKVDMASRADGKKDPGQALTEITSAFKGLNPSLTRATEITDRYIEKVLVPKTDINGLFNNVSPSREVVLAAYNTLTTSNRPNPTADDVGKFLSDNAVSTHRWLGRERGVQETLLIAPLDSNGNRVDPDDMVDAIVWGLSQDGKKPEDFIIENDTMQGYNNAIIVRDKNTNAAVKLITGDYINEVKSYLVNKNKGKRKPVVSVGARDANQASTTMGSSSGRRR